MGKGKRIRQARKGDNNPRRPIEQIEEQARTHEEKAAKHRDQAKKLRAKAKAKKAELKGRHSKKGKAKASA